jgi:serine/threonine protein kinase
MSPIVQIVRRGLSNNSLTASSNGSISPIHNGSQQRSGGGEKQRSSSDKHKPGRSLASKDAGSKLVFESFYKLDKRLSKGSFGVVYVTKHIASGKEFAVKVIEIAQLSEKERQGVDREISILKDCRGVENIVQLVDFFVSPEKYYVVQGYAQGGDVFERLAQRTSYTESLARTLAKNLLQAVEVLASRKLAHRDLKPENLLLKDVLDDSSIVVADFGFASYVPEGGLKTRCGTPAFVGPEVLSPHCRYDERCDMWSVGCLLYMLIAGYPPFQDRNHKGLFKKIRGADYVFHEMYWKNVSIPAKRLIASLLTADPKFRCTAREALDSSPWLLLDEALLKSHDLSASLGEIKKFHAKRTLKTAVHTVLLTVKHKFRSAGDVEGGSPTSSSAHPSSPVTAEIAYPPTFDDEDENWDREGAAAHLIEEEHVREPYIKENSDSVLLRTLRPALGFYDLYETGELMHNGHTSKVYECTYKATRAVFAVKIVARKQRARKSVRKTMAEAVIHEVAILDSMRHENIIEIIEFFEDDDYFYLVMECLRGGDVFDRIVEMKKYTEFDARILIRRLLEATALFHSHKVAHRDLKPQNLLLRDRNDPTSIVVCDFGFACRVHTPQSLTTRCGTPSYVAPEVLKNAPYDQMADLWSIGVILFVLLCGYPPFVDENHNELFRKIRMSEWKFRGEEWETVSDEAKEVVKGLLVGNPVQRMSAERALQCSWFQPSDAEFAARPKVVPAAVKESGSGAGVKEESSRGRKSKVQNSVKSMTSIGKSRPTENTSKPSSKSQPDLVEKRRSEQRRKQLGPEHLRTFEC